MNFAERQIIYFALTHLGRVMHICVSRLTVTGSDNGLSPGRRQAIIWTNDGILLIGPLGTNCSENFIEIAIESVVCEMAAILSRSQCVKCDFEDPIRNKSALLQVMAWHQTGNRPLPEPMMTQFSYLFMHCESSMTE